MDKLYQVFLSSTFVDLIEERRAVSNMLAKAGYMVAGMELFPATDQQQFEYIKTVIDRSDYYIVITAARYGSLSGGGISFTEMEYDYAQARGIPVLAFLHGNPGSIASDRTDRDAEKENKLVAFRDRLKSNRLVETWNDVGDLCARVVIAVGNEKTLKPAVGWIRGDQAADPKVMQELARLNVENARLHEQLRLLQATEIHFDPDLIGPSDNLELTVSQWHDGKKRPPLKLSLRIGLLFVNLYDLLLMGPREDSLDYKIASVALLLAGEQEMESNTLDALSLVRLRDQLEALGLIKPESQSDGSLSGASVVWMVTNKGRQYASSMRALKRTANHY
ncbi:DUF4062 domain-containing protein [Tardiphaga sp. P9-11]|uniref:DUF4062 domain-containing protein n=1 Tax=Tardiphaga sp. P9-11 TaxID=2024614 RepID=UPI0011F3370F|nr:DUF4062 domain-containing protein [Tardiphaga sp. P9-11]KAA0076124.1 DUF4062 domain-containing protein [Tardiphaga sp. P9-11]